MGFAAAARAEVAGRTWEAAARQLAEGYERALSGRPSARLLTAA